MDFQKLCTFETFQQVWSHYGYGHNLQDVIEQEFTRIKGNLMYSLCSFMSGSSDKPGEVELLITPKGVLQHNLYHWIKK